MSPEALHSFAAMDTGKQVTILYQSSALETEAGDTLLGHLAGNYPERYSALMDALGREEI